MRKIITALCFAVAIFAGFTVWSDPVVGPKVQAMVPKGVSNSFPSISGISKGTGGKATGKYGGIGAANGVAKSVVGSVKK